MVVVVTGASSGIGAALAAELGRRGQAVVLAARRLPELREAAERCGNHALAVQADVTRREEVQRLLGAALQRFGRVDAWVNNAGRGITRPVEQLSDDDVDAMVRDNLKSALYGIQAVLPHFKERGEGAIVNVSSFLARAPFATFRSAYSASKAALNSLGETLRFELSQQYSGIRVITVMPGVVATDFGLNALGGGPDSRALPNAQDATDVARIVADAIPTARGDVYTRPGLLDAAVEHLRRLGGAA
ncbi:MAG TPA: SDR family oxidoreductase [Myxococcales bacterium]|nr:SDR family oxidoreductase [Myxococcales bacterium]